MDENYDVMFLIQDHIETQKHLFAKSLASVLSQGKEFTEYHNNVCLVGY